MREELGDDVGAKLNARAALVRLAAPARVRVGPQAAAHELLRVERRPGRAGSARVAQLRVLVGGRLRRVVGAVERLELGERDPIAVEEPAVDDEHALAEHGRDRQVLEDLDEHVEDLRAAPGARDRSATDRTAR